MSRDLNLLQISFREKVEVVLAECQHRGITMTPYATMRTPHQQARLWRQSRTSAEIQERVQWLRENGAPYLASVIEEVGPQFGKKVTNAIPGLSWHQWGEAVDCFWNRDDRAEWSSRKKVLLPDGTHTNGYHMYARMSTKHGLNAGGFWSSFKDWPHIQFRSQRLSSFYTIQEIDRHMQESFAHTSPA
jgi:peptidoglycan LD-endopeptidase CwlK